MNRGTGPLRYFAGLVVHRDTIVACVCGQGQHRIMLHQGAAAGGRSVINGEGSSVHGWRIHFTRFG